MMSIRLVLLYGACIAIGVSCNNKPAARKEIKGFRYDTAAAGPAWVDPMRGKIKVPTDMSQVLLKAYDQHILGPVKLVRSRIYSADDTGKRLERMGLDEYNKGSFMTAQRQYDPGGGTVREYLFSYDSLDRLLMWDIRNAESGAGTKAQFRYDVRGNRTEELLVTSIKGYEKRVVNSYDDKGHRIESKVYTAERPLPVVSVYSFDNNGNEVGYVHRGEDGRTDDKMTRSYDAAGNGIAGVIYISDTMMRTRWTAQYDYRNRMTGITWYHKDGSVAFDTRMVYDGRDNVIESRTYDVSGSQVAYADNYFKEYSYDDHGNARSEYTYKIVDGKKVLSTIVIREFEYY